MMNRNDDNDHDDNDNIHRRTTTNPWNNLKIKSNFFIFFFF